MDHALKFKKGFLVTIRHKNVADDLGALCTSTLTPSAVAQKPLINYGGKRTVMGATVA